jgi:putative Mg2+ transporter-C (MgtC) family protein
MEDVSSFAGQWRTWTPEWIIAIRLVAACVLGGLIGLEREIRNHDAGLRTHILVALGGAVFTLVAWELFRHTRDVSPGSNADPVRVIEAVTAGAGFLAAGIVFQAKGRVHGLTTGAGVWTAAAIGVACGAGAYAIAGIATVLVLTILIALRVFERVAGFRERPPAPANEPGHPPR